MLNIVQETMEIIQSKFCPFVSSKHIHQFRFGVQAFTLSSFESLKSNARLVVEKPNTAHSKMHRLTANADIIASFHRMIPHLNLLTKESIVIIDFSDFCGFQTLTFALQTQEGRAIPLFFDSITYPITEATSQNIFIQECVNQLGDILGFYPRFVLDRGFAIPSLITFFIERQILFYVRAKKNKGVTIIDEHGEEHLLPASHVPTYDKSIKAYGYQLRLITSEKPKDKEEPWYIITNDGDSKRKDIITIYYYRFEIEEAFKDLKHLFDLKKLRIKQKNTFRILLWFFLLSMWIAYLIYLLKERVKQQGKQQISFVRSWYEGFQRSMFLSTFNLLSHNQAFY